jgi:hypothetical protein
MLVGGAAAFGGAAVVGITDVPEPAEVCSGGFATRAVVGAADGSVQAA